MGRSLGRVESGLADPVPDDADEDQRHPDHDDEMRRMLLEWEAGAGGRESKHEGVFDEVEEEAEAHRQQARLGDRRERTAHWTLGFERDRHRHLLAGFYK